MAPEARRDLEDEVLSIEADPLKLKAALFRVLPDLEGERAVAVVDRVLKRLTGPGIVEEVRELFLESEDAFRIALLRLMVAGREDTTFRWMAAQLVDPEGETDRDVMSAMAHLISDDPGLLLPFERWAQKHATPSHQRALLNTIGWARLPDGLPIAMAGLRSEEPGIRLAALNALSQLELAPMSAPPVVREMLKSDDPRIRKQTVLALGAFLDLRTAPKLIDRLDDRNPGIRKNAWHSLKRLTGKRFAVDSGSWEQWWEVEGSRAMVDVDRFCALLRASEWSKRVEAIRGLLPYASFQGGYPVERVRGCLRDPTPSVRAAACKYIIASRGSDAIQDLIAQLDDPDPSVREVVRLGLKALVGHEPHGHMHP